MRRQSNAEVESKSDSFVCTPRTAAERSYDGLADLAKQGRSLSQIEDHVTKKHSLGNIAKRGLLGSLSGSIAGATWGAIGTTLAAGGGLAIAAVLVVGGTFFSAGIGVSALPSLLAAVGATAIPSSPGLLSQLPSIALGCAGVGGAVGAAATVYHNLQQKQLDQVSLARLEQDSKNP